MKINIKRINYDGTLNDNGNWWKWDEFCDLCGADCKKSDWQVTSPPNINEKDYCINCLRKLLDEKKGTVKNV